MKPHEVLRKARIAAGFSSASDAARFFGEAIPTYISRENGTKPITAEAAQRYSAAFNISLDVLFGRALSQNDIAKNVTWTESGLVPVIGRAAAGAWLEVPLSESDIAETIPVVAQFSGGKHFALKVDGLSMDRLFQPGEYVVCSPWAEVGRDAKDGDIVVIQRERHGLFETTLKRVRKAGDRIEFWPESNDPRYQEPIDVAVNDGETVSIIGLVVLCCRRI